MQAPWALAQSYYCISIGCTIFIGAPAKAIDIGVHEYTKSHQSAQHITLSHLEQL